MGVMACRCAWTPRCASSAGSGSRSTGGTVRFLPSSRTLLALRGALPRSAAVGTLWRDVAESRALARLRTATWRLGRSGIMLCDPSSDVLRCPPGL